MSKQTNNTPDVTSSISAAQEVLDAIQGMDDVVSRIQSAVNEIDVKKESALFAIDAKLGLISSSEENLLTEDRLISRGRPKTASAEEVVTEGEVEVDPMAQIRADIALLEKQVGAVDKLQAQIVALPGKEEIVAAVLSRIPAPKCSCQKERHTTEARDPDYLAGIKLS